MRSSRTHRLLAFLLVAMTAFTAGAVGIDREGATLDGGPSSIAFDPPAITPGAPPCEGNNHANNLFFDPCLMGGPMVAMSWIPTASVAVSGLEVFSGEATAPSALAIWSDDGGSPSKPLAALGVTGTFIVSPPNTWYGADLDVLVPVVAGTKYWVVWDPTGSEQCSCTDQPSDIQQTYWGSTSGTVNGGADWFGPFSFPDRRWKFRMYCEGGGCPDADGDTVCDDADLCPDTTRAAVSPEVELGVNRWADVDGDGVFDTVEPQGLGPKVTFTMQDTGGCSCDQIIEALGIGEGHEKFGCSTGIMRRWAAMVAP